MKEARKPGESLEDWMLRLISYEDDEARFGEIRARAMLKSEKTAKKKYFAATTHKAKEKYKNLLATYNVHLY